MATQELDRLVEEIRVARTRSRLSQDDLARAINMHPATLIRRMQTPAQFRVSEVRAIADELGVEFTIEFGGVDVSAA